MKINNIISHGNIKESILFQDIQAHITKHNNKRNAHHLLKIFEQLKEIPLARFLLANKGLNGCWTDYILTYPYLKNNISLKNDLEYFILERCPVILATQERFRIFLSENQKSVKENAHLASIPCGLMSELLFLDLTHIKNITLTGIDLDKESLRLIDKKLIGNNRTWVNLIKQDAWNLNISNEFDLISSNGLNIYTDDPIKITSLFASFYFALKKGGKFVTSFLTFPPHLTIDCEWQMSKIKTSDLLLQKNIFIDIINARWQCYSSSTQIKKQLEQVGFRNINFIYDQARLFPTVIAFKDL